MEQNNTQVAQYKGIKLPAALKQTLDPVFKLAQETFVDCECSMATYQREAQFALQAITKNDYSQKLALAKPRALLDAIKNVALTGLSLNPELKLGYLVPRDGQIVFQASYMGKIDLAIKAGIVKKFEVNLVYQNDFFEIEQGTNAHLTHRPVAFGERGPLIGGYYLFILPSGEAKFDTMPLAQMQAIKKRSPSVKKGSFSPWQTDEEEMYRKTVYNWGWKFVPKSGLSDYLLKLAQKAGSTPVSLEYDEYDDKGNIKPVRDFDSDTAYIEDQQGQNIEVEAIDVTTED